jgi:hypothetical protein
MSSRRLFSRLSFVALLAGLLVTPLGAPAASAAEVVKDGGFEATVGAINPNWQNEDSLYAEGNLCLVPDRCGYPDQTYVVPRTGSGLVWFGGTSTAGHTAYVRQSIVIPPDRAMLRFFVWKVDHEEPLDATLRVSIDGTTVTTLTEPAVNDTGYVQHEVDVSAFATGNTRTLEFSYANPSLGYAEFFLDDVSLVSTDTIAPETTITSAPAGGIAKSLTVPIGFAASEAGSTFKCALDGGAYAACASPASLKVTPGKHTVRVVATDASGNADASPATVAFKAYDCATLKQAVQKARKKVKAIKAKLRAAKADDLTSKVERLEKKLKKAKKALRKAKRAYEPC